MKTSLEQLSGRGSSSPLRLDDGSRVAVIGGGPAGSFFSYFLLDMAERMGFDIHVDLYEPRDFSGLGPGSCNMCGGIISESLVQELATEGINLPGTVVQRGIESYVLHMDVGTVRIATPIGEKRIGAVHRASGPRDLKVARWESFDGFLQGLALERGAKLIRERVTEAALDTPLPQLRTKEGTRQAYDLMAVAAGINSPTLKLFDGNGTAYHAPKSTKTFIREYFFGEDVIAAVLGPAMHVFLLNIPNLEFAAIIPKGDYASVCLLGDGLDKKTLETFLDSPEVHSTMPDIWDPYDNSCQCAPKISTSGAHHPYGDRLVFIGDSGSTRLYKDGIGAAYRTAKAAASTAIFQGVAAVDFERGYFPVCKKIEKDNSVGKLIFGVSARIQGSRMARQTLLRVTTREQAREGNKRTMSTVLWDLFTGSASYGEIFRRTLTPSLVLRLAWGFVASAAGNAKRTRQEGT